MSGHRPPPALSVVIAAWNGAEYLRACLASLRGQAGDDVEVVVARNFDGAATAIVADFPGAVDVPMPEVTTVPALRGAGLTRARAPLVAFLEDHAVCANGWVAALLRAHQAPHAAVGGPVEQGGGATRLDWAAYFADYGRYMPPCEAGPAPDLSGINVSYKREALDALCPLLADGVFEAALHAELRRRGLTLYLEPDALVVHRKHYRARTALAHAFHLARGYAAGRLAGAGVAHRIVRAATTLLLPLLLLTRICLRVCRKRRNRGALAAAAPWLLALLSAWSAGEGAGYLAGAGNSAQRWR